MRRLMDFEGTWAIDRVIEDRLGGSGRFVGQARFAPDGAGLRYHEDGVLTLGTGASMRAERSYVWRQDGPRSVVTFDDHRPFHSFDPMGSGAGDRHHCDPDIYDVIYDFDAWPKWSSVWTVIGPRKDYVMRSDFLRLERT